MTQGSSPCGRPSADTGELEVRPRSVGHFPTQVKAFRKADESVRLRDANPAEVEGNPLLIKPENVLRTHFRYVPHLTPIMHEARYQGNSRRDAKSAEGPRHFLVVTESSS